MCSVVFEGIPFVFDFGQRFGLCVVSDLAGGADINDLRAGEGVLHGLDQGMSLGLGAQRHLLGVAQACDGLRAALVD